jgi:hypothetical protein
MEVLMLQFVHTPKLLGVTIYHVVLVSLLLLNFSGTPSKVN